MLLFGGRRREPAGPSEAAVPVVPLVPDPPSAEVDLAAHGMRLAARVGIRRAALAHQAPPFSHCRSSETAHIGHSGRVVEGSEVEIGGLVAEYRWRPAGRGVLIVDHQHGYRDALLRLGEVW